MHGDLRRSRVGPPGPGPAAQVVGLAGVRAARPVDLGVAGGAEALVERTRLIHEYRMFPFRDPGLPAELLPADWRGRAAHDLFLAGFGLLRAPAVDHYRAVLRRCGEPQGKENPARP